MMSEDARVYWADFVAATGVKAAPTSVFKFGDSAEMADELLALVLGGVKRATAGLLRDIGDDEPLPVVGGYSIVLDGCDRPRCVIRTVEVEIKPLSEADEQFAWDEGEGDRSLAWWMDAHVWFFSRQAEQEGFAMHRDIETVFERFEVVWPPLSAPPK
jgi:uncharacterized protein YhfF